MLHYLADRWSTWRITTFIKQRFDHPNNEGWVVRLTNELQRWEDWPGERNEPYIRSIILRMYIHHKTKFMYPTLGLVTRGGIYGTGISRAAIF